MIINCSICKTVLRCSDDVWKIHRKSLNYSFNLKILQTFIPTFIENANKLVDELSVNIGKAKEFDMLTYTTKSALNMICGSYVDFNLFEKIISIWCDIVSSNVRNFHRNLIWSGHQKCRAWWWRIPCTWKVSSLRINEILNCATADINFDSPD